MNMPGKKIILSLLAVVVVLGGASILWQTGLLPLVPGQEADVAFADTTGVDEPDTEKDDPDAEPQEKPIPVELCLVEGRGISSYYRAASVIEADRLVELVSRTSGRVHVLNVEEGDWVTEDQILAELENDRERIQLRKAVLNLSDKKRQLDRSREMLAEELISQQEFDDMDSAWQMAKAERDLAGINLEDTRIRASFEGRITERMIVPGQQLATNSPAFTIGDFTPLRVRVHLPEAIARKVAQGQRVLVSPEAVDNPLEAIVERISPVVDPATSTVRLTLLLDESADGARVGGFVKVRITTDEHHEALAIPKIALVEDGALRSVFVAEADTVRKVEIETGLYDESHVEILEGLFEGDFVVTMGQGGLRTGSRVEALNGEAVGYSQAPVIEEDPAADSGDLTAMATTE
ncbi:MAG: efflux RND transporter periplasmic adaptor subunit [Candidatus Krumholzibacteria bacterium]|nr:efflux RND transporter periplasmic adaptor subunit [Candidatus Krumholzibacteria bacterium]